MNTAPERMLDDILEGRTISGDPAMSQLVATASLLEATLRPAVPPMGQARALFAGGVAARRTGLTWRQLTVPAMAMLSLVIAAGSIASRALPGDALYPVRKALGAVGLVEPSTEAIDKHIVAAARLIETAERDVSAGEPVRAIGLARRSLSELVSASALLTDLSEEQRSVREIAITSLQERAAAIISAPGTGRQVTPEAGDDGSKRDGEGRGSDNDSGEGSNQDESEGASSDDDSGSDNSGRDRDDEDHDGNSDDRSGSGDDGDDNSGSGSDDSGDKDDEPDGDELDVDDPDDDAIDSDEIDVDQGENG